MSQALSTVQHGGGIGPTAEFLTAEHKRIIKSTLCPPDTTDDEALFFFAACERLKMDPFARQIHLVIRKVWNKDTKQYDRKLSIQTGIDGYRSIADDTGEYAGSDDAEYGPDIAGTTHPSHARVTVYRIVQGQRVPFTATAFWSEFVQTKADGLPVQMWQKMPKNQLAKCAEALALRKAFPRKLAGIYTHDEMGQADNVVAAPVAAPKPMPQRKAVLAPAVSQALPPAVAEPIVVVEETVTAPASAPVPPKPKPTPVKAEVVGPAPAKTPKPPAAPAPEKPKTPTKTWRGIIIEIVERRGTKGNKPWLLNIIKGEDFDCRTFDQKLQEAAFDFKTAMSVVDIEYTEDGTYGPEVVGIKLAAPPTMKEAVENSVDAAEIEQDGVPQSVIDAEEGR